MNKIKKFFKKKKDEAAFMSAGPGRKLNANPDEATASPSNPKTHRDAYVPPNRNELSAEARAAADAALARTQNKKDSRQFNTSLAAIKLQVQRELEAEKLEGKSKETVSNSKPIEQDNKSLAVQGVFFRCPLISDEVLPRSEWKVKIREFLYEQLETEPGLTACLIIHNCNVKDKAEACTETLSKYIENVVNNPDDEKYRKIRLTNRIFCERVRGVEGGYEFLIGAGFVEQTIDEEAYLIYSSDEIDQLPELLDALRNAERIALDLDRNVQVLLLSQARKFDLPPDFYRVSPEEAKKEQKLRTDAIESAQILKTKAMREKEELRTINLYKFSLIRIRFPDGVFLQGTFSVYDKVADVYEFVRSCLKDESFEYTLIVPAGPKLLIEDYEKTLYAMRLVPSVLLNFTYENMSNSTGNFLKEDLLMLIQPV